MDLSAVIFVVLALAWAVYLIPKALKHHDEMASDRLEHGHSDRVRILSRHRTAPAPQKAAASSAPETVETTAAPVPVVQADVADVAPAAQPARARIPTRAAARRAARNRRRVLGVLLGVLLVVTGLAAASVLPWWTVAVPAALSVGFLVLARVTVRGAQQARAAHRPAAGATPVATAPEAAPQTAAHAETSTTESTLEELAHAPLGVRRQELETALADDGSLWDPLPLTLPTYVNKARARRTVRTIELTGMNSSGHDESDSALAREAAEQSRSGASEASEAGEQRRVAGA